MKQKLLALSLLWAVFALTVWAQTPAQQTALDRYIAQKDSVYGWKLVNTLNGDGCAPMCWS